MTSNAPTWTPKAIEQRDPATLIDSPTNVNKHSKDQIAKLAKSISAYGFPVPILIDSAGVIIAGHGRKLAALKLKLETVPCIVADHLSDDERRAYTIADNQLAKLSEIDGDALAREIAALTANHIDLSNISFDHIDLDRMLGNLKPTPDEAGQHDNIPAVAKGDPDSKPGLIYQLGPHRLLCGDSTDPIHVAALITAVVGYEPAALLHADPPYGMGKENDGVENDNLYADKLTKFQMAWWRTWRPYLANNGGAYIWGNAPELWRLWYGELEKSERLTYRNEITWDKGNCTGITSDEMRQYPTATERCLFFMIGEQGFGNVNKDDFWDGFAPMLNYLEEQIKIMKWTAGDIKKITGVGMYGHWFSKSQWHLIPERHYQTLATAANGAAFLKPYKELRAIYDGKTTEGGHLAAKHEFYALRAYFDNTHDHMTDVWKFPRVSGEERHGHATPKPVDLVARAIKSSCPVGGLVLEPFGGSGSTLIAAAVTRRICYTAEITPAYCDVIRRRWTTYAKQHKLDAGTGALE